MNKLLDTAKTVMLSAKFWLSLQAAALVWGNYVGWSTIYNEVQVFCEYQGAGARSLLSFSGTITTNPLLTPCFWGSISFVICLVWTIRLLFMKDTQRRASEHKKLIVLLVASVLFAAANNVPLFYRFYTLPRGTAQGCSPGKFMTSPFLTSCFLGFSAFALATVASLGAKHTKS